MKKIYKNIGKCNFAGKHFKSFNINLTCPKKFRIFKKIILYNSKCFENYLHLS